MCKQLREFGGLDDVSLHVTKHIIAKGLNYLRYVEESHVHGMTFQCSHGILENERMAAVGRQKVGHCCDRVHRGPKEKVLQGLAYERWQREPYKYLQLRSNRRGQRGPKENLKCIRIADRSFWEIK